MGAAEYPRELRGARRDRDRRLERLYAAGPRGLSPLESDDARRLAVGHRRGLRLPRRALGKFRHRRNADGGWRRPALGRDLDHREAGVFWWRGWMSALPKPETSHLPLQHRHI